MRILIITQWFDPEPTFKGLLFAKELQRRGHKVSVLTGFPNYPGGAVYEGYRIRPFQSELMDGIPVLRVALYPSHDQSGSRRALNYLSFASMASVAAALIRRPDVAYVYHPPGTLGLPAVTMKLLRGVPFVYDVQDLWPDTLAATGMVTSDRVLGAADLVMRRIYGSATKLVVLSDGFKTALTSRGIPGRRITIIPNWADEQSLDFRAPDAERAQQLGFSDRTTITFAGNIGTAQSLDTILDAAEMLADLPRLRFLIVGGGTDSDRLAEESRRRSLTNVEFLPRVPLSEIGAILTLSDAVLVHLRDDPLFAITIPSKTQAYMLAGRPVLMGVRGDAAQLVKDARAGLIFEPENPASLAAVVRDFVSMPTSEREALGRAGHMYYTESLCLEAGASHFIRVFEEAAALKPRILATKRLLDVLAASLGLALLAVPMMIILVLVRVKLGSPGIFRQMRPGRDGEPFEMFKFRTMTDERDAHGNLLPDGQRLTGIGHFLRSTSLDELPELWNVLVGDMSLVGPRPLLMRYTPYFTDEEATRLSVRPGITGWAQINGRNRSSWDSRLASDVWYVRHLSIWLDVKILLRTLFGIFGGNDVVVDAESEMQNLDDERMARPS